MSTTREVLGFQLVLTCSACPEQYDVFLGERQVGYIRFRWGSLEVDFLRCGGRALIDERLLRHSPDSGQLRHDDRSEVLQRACAAIAKALSEE